MKVAVIGGGVAGLACAARLGQLKIQGVTVFDTGKHAVGGRCSSRVEVINGQAVTFDHSVQYFTASDPRFKKIVDYLERDGAVRAWAAPVGRVCRGRFHNENTNPSKKLFIGTEGMRSVPQSLAKFCRVQRPGWVGSLQWDEQNRKWTVDKWGQFDYVVIAHNGKCAARLTENAGIQEIHRLCQTRFSPTVNPRDSRMTLCSLFVLMVAFESSLRLPFHGAHVDQDPNISWVANNTAKLKKSDPATPMLRWSGEAWTIISTKTLADQNKVPQENIPPKVASQVTDTLLKSLQDVTGVKALPTVLFTRLQLWGAAVPINTFSGGSECIFDSRHQIGICSDWLVSPCIQGAAVSGLAMAEAIGQHWKGGAESRQASSPLQPKFEPVHASSPIGDFP